MSVQNPPEGFRSVTPYLTVSPAAEAIDWYKRALGAEELFRMPHGDRIGHAEIRIGNSIVMLSDEFPDMNALGPKTLKGTSVGFMVYLDGVDAAYAKAVAAGATGERPPKDEFYGDRMGIVVDPFGHRWMLATHVEDVSPEELGRRAAAAMGS